MYLISSEVVCTYICIMFDLNLMCIGDIGGQSRNDVERFLFVVELMNVCAKCNLYTGTCKFCGWPNC